MEVLSQVTQQTTLLGYQPGDKLYIRCLPGKGFDVKADKLYPFDGYLTVGTWEFTRLHSQKQGGGVKYVTKFGLDALQRYNDDGYGIYLVVNPGGRADEDIKECRALFYECDDIDLIEQWERIWRLPLEPSLIIQTRNSLHVYYRLTAGITPEEWRTLQQRLIQLMESDRSIHNPSRLMRLAGFKHQKKDHYPVKVNIQAQTDNVYDVAAIASLLPEWDGSKWADSKEVDEDWQAKAQELKSKRQTIIPSNEAFPLEICLSKQDRDLIDYGVAKGEGYIQGYKLACNLIGTEKFLQSAGYRFEGTAESLFTQFALNSSESYHGSKDVEKVLKDAAKTNPTPTLSADAIENCIKAWQRKNGDVVWEQINNIQTKPAKGIDAKKGLLATLNGIVDAVKDKLKRRSKGLIKAKNVIYFNGDDRVAFTEEMTRKHKYILDISPTGSGKSYAMGQISAQRSLLIPDGDDGNNNKIIYACPSHRNPTNKELEKNYFETVARNGGYKLNHDKLTAAGNPYRESATDDELFKLADLDRTESNCKHYQQFYNYYAANQPTDGICGACNLKAKCATSQGDGYGYLKDSTQWTTKNYIRTSPQWLDSDKVTAFPTALFCDEAGQYTWTYDVVVDWAEFRGSCHRIKKALLTARADQLEQLEASAEYKANPDAFADERNQIIKAIEVCKQLSKLIMVVANELEEIYTEELPRYGLKLADILEKDIDIPQLLIDNLQEILKAELTLAPDPVDEFAEVPKLFFHDLLGILTRKQPGSLHISKTKLTISQPNFRLRNACIASKSTVFQDATLSPQHMAWFLGIDVDDIVVICQRSTVPENLTIEHWKGLGNLSNGRTESQDALIKTIRQQLKEQHPNIGFIDWKQKRESSDLIHCGDSRGSNAYQAKDIVVAIGLPRPNMTAVALEFEALTNQAIASYEDDDYAKYYNHATAANIIQEFGRLRANRRSESVKFILLGDGDVSFLHAAGYKVQDINTYELYPELGLRRQGARARYLAMATRIAFDMDLDQWLSLTQAELAELLDRAASSLCRWLDKYFGLSGDKKGQAFERFQQMVIAVIHRKKTPDGKLPKERLEFIQALADVLIPPLLSCPNEQIGQDLMLILKSCCWDDFLEAIGRIKHNQGLAIIARLFNVAHNTMANA